MTNFKFLETEAYPGRDDLAIQHEFKFKNDVVKPGTRIKFLNDRATYLFRCYVHNIHEDVTWIDCVDSLTHQHRSFYFDRLKGVVKAKRSRRRKPME